MTDTNYPNTASYMETNAEVIEKAQYCLKHRDTESVENWQDLLHDRLNFDTSRAVALTDAARDVLLERRRQIEVKGWTSDHDDEHTCEEMAVMAAYLAMPIGVRNWRMNGTSHGPTLGQAILPDGWFVRGEIDRRRELVKAAALALAEIERMDRAQPRNNG